MRKCEGKQGGQSQLFVNVGHASSELHGMSGDYAWRFVTAPCLPVVSLEDV